jgi:signal transduction histidine kinase
LREVGAALRRFQTEKIKAQKAAIENLRSELNGALTGILLSADLALSAGPLTATAEDKLHSIQQLAQTMRQHLDTKQVAASAKSRGPEA